MRSHPLMDGSTAGTSRCARIPIPRSPHAFKPEHVQEWGYRPRCETCSQERGHALHQEGA